MKVQIVKTFIEKLLVTIESIEKKDNLELEVGIGKIDSISNFFVIKFDIKLISDGTRIECVSVSQFECDNEIHDAFLKSNFAKINAPAIAFPYVRANIASITQICGLPPIHLPTINFVEFMKDCDVQEIDTENLTP